MIFSRLFLLIFTNFFFNSTLYSEIKEKKIILSQSVLSGSNKEDLTLKSVSRNENLNSKLLRQKPLFSRNLLTRAPVVVSSTPHTLTDNINLSATDTLEFDNASPGSDKDMVLNGDGHFLSFPAGSSTQGLILDENVDLTVNDTVLKKYNPAAISFAGAGGTLATISFGDDCIVELGADQTIADADAAWTFTGDATLNGFGNTLRIEKASGLTVADAKTVTLKNLKIVTTVVDGLKCLGNDSHLKLQDCEFVLQDAGFDFDTGHLDIAGIVVLEGANLSDQNRTEFLFSTGGNLTIGENAILKVEPYVNFKYDTAANTQIIFSYSSSTIHFNGCGIESGDNGIKLVTGVMIVENLVDFVISTVGGGEAELQDPLKIIFLSGSKLNVQGPLIYSYLPPALTYGSSFNLKNELYGTYLRMNVADPVDLTSGSPTIENLFILTNGLQDGLWGNAVTTYNGGVAPYYFRQANTAETHLVIRSLGPGEDHFDKTVITGASNLGQLPGLDMILASHAAASASSQAIDIYDGGSYTPATELLPYSLPISQGDRICLFTNLIASYNRSGAWFHAISSTTLDMLQDTFGELNAPPSDDSHIWIVENITNGDYLNYP